MTQVNFDSSLSKLQLNCAVIEREKRNAGHAAHANASAADVNFTARVLVGPEVIAGSKGTIRVGLHPILIAGNLVGDGTLNVIQARDAARRILSFLPIFILRCSWLRNGCEERCEEEREGK